MINWKEVPFCRLLPGLIAGIIMGRFVPDYYHAAALIGLLSGLLVFIYGFLSFSFAGKGIYGVLLLLFLLCVGYLRTVQLEQQGGACISEYSGFSLVQLTSSTTESGKYLKAKVTVTPLQYMDGQVSISTTFNGMLFIEKNDSVSVPAYGDQLLVKGEWLRPAGGLTPLAFNNQAFLRNDFIYFQSFVKKDQWKRVQEGSFSFKRFALQCQAYLSRQLSLYIDNRESYGVLAALVLGDKSALETYLKSAYANTGAIHVLAVSGLHVGLILLILQFVFRFFFKNIKGFSYFSPVLVISAIWLFAMLTGGAPSVLRAATMFSFIIIGKALNRFANIYNVLAASAFVLLWFHPFLIFQIGFQLSYFAVVGIVFFQPLIYQWWTPKNRLMDWVWQLSSVGLAAQLTTAPLGLFYFHQFPVYFWLSGLIVIPAASIVLSSSVVLLTLSFIWQEGARFIGFFLSSLVKWMNFLIQAIEALPFSLIEHVYIDVTFLLGCYGGIFLLMVSIGIKSRFIVIRVLIVLLLLSAYHAGLQWLRHNRHSVQAYFHSNLLVIDFIIGTKAYAYESGKLNNEFASEQIREYRRALGITKVERLTDMRSVLAENDFVVSNGGVLMPPSFFLLFAYEGINFSSLQLQPEILIIDNPCSYDVLSSIPSPFKAGLWIAAPSYSKCLDDWKLKCLENKWDCHFLCETSFLYYEQTDHEK